MIFVVAVYLFFIAYFLYYFLLLNYIPVCILAGFYLSLLLFRPTLFIILHFVSYDLDFPIWVISFLNLFTLISAFYLLLLLYFFFGLFPFCKPKCFWTRQLFSFFWLIFSSKNQFIWLSEQYKLKDDTPQTIIVILEHEHVYSKSFHYLYKIIILY